MIVITSEGIRIVEGLTQEVIQSVFIKNISFTTAVDKNSVFAYISNDARLGRRSCHAFQCSSKVRSVCMTVAEHW